ncbi:uncharacterized protein [Nicotiana tomentosiformis]|uniref:uncharacterized protein n=1 Tax=Nicotiana tomentosiformis TaxID=4098 RepID=UPI00388C38D6
MAKISKIVPHKEKASSSQSTAVKTLMEPRPEEFVPGACVLTSDFKVDKASSVPDRCLGKDTVMRPPSVEEETSAPVPKPTKDNKRKRAFTSEDPEPKTRMAHKPRRKIIPLTEESVRRLRDKDEEEEEEEEEEVGRFVLVARVKKTIDTPKAAGSMVVYEAQPRTEGISEKDSGRVPESLEIQDSSHRSQQKVGISEGAGPKALRTEENDPSESLGAIAAAVHREACSRSRAKLHRAKELEADAEALASDDDDDDDGSKRGSESEEEPDGEETASRDNQET